MILLSFTLNLPGTKPKMCLAFYLGPKRSYLPTDGGYIRNKNKIFPEDIFNSKRTYRKLAPILQS